MTKHKSAKRTDLTPVAVRRTDRVDWAGITANLREHPGQWFRYEGKPTAANPSLVREGTPRAFLPAGSFDAFIRGGHLYFCFLGEPIEPWRAPRNWDPSVEYDPRTFAELERPPLPDAEQEDEPEED